jgi:hypothetical protein
MQASLVESTKLTYFSYAHPLKGGSTFSISMTQLAASGFEQVNAVFDPVSGEPTSVASGGSFSEADQAIGLSTRKLGPSSDSFKTLDMGVLKTMGPYRLGLGFQNGFSQKTGDSSDKLPVVIKVGNSMHLFKDRLNLALDASKSINGALDMRFGGEYWISRHFAFRFGLLGLPAIQETDFGFGFNFKSFSIDIAQGIHDLGNSTRFSFTFRFGQSKEDRSPRR